MSGAKDTDWATKNTSVDWLQELYYLVKKLDYALSHNRSMYEPANIKGWDTGIFHDSIGRIVIWPVSSARWLE
jgi:hypothetical protein